MKYLPWMIFVLATLIVMTPFVLGGFAVCLALNGYFLGYRLFQLWFDYEPAGAREILGP